ncbi:hypothetical protein BDB01DRAFT_838897 [Pilobolus umbonatus]|nr:hypothetical protein BDB01DRAFT_838897 [Pilobolus umbonatus]
MACQMFYQGLQVTTLIGFRGLELHYFLRDTYQLDVTFGDMLKANTVYLVWDSAGNSVFIPGMSVTYEAIFSRSNNLDQATTVQSQPGLKPKEVLYEYIYEESKALYDRTLLSQITGNLGLLPINKDSHLHKLHHHISPRRLLSTSNRVDRMVAIKNITAIGITGYGISKSTFKQLKKMFPSYETWINQKAASSLKIKWPL